MLLFIFIGSEMADVFQKNKTALFHQKFIFQKFSLTDHLNVITTNINIYFVYQLAKGIKMVTIGPLLLRACLFISEKYHLDLDIY